MIDQWVTPSSFSAVNHLGKAKCPGLDAFLLSFLQSPGHFWVSKLHLVHICQVVVVLSGATMKCGLGELFRSCLTSYHHRKQKSRESLPDTLLFCLKSSASIIHVYRLLFASDECNYRISHTLNRIKACKRYFQWEASNMLGQDKWLF